MNNDNDGNRSPDLERSRNAIEIFEEAVNLDARSQTEFLNQSCGDDPELRREVDLLLQSDTAAGKFLTSPLVDLESVYSGSEIELHLAGKHVGKFQIESLIADGGMGRVFRAHQDAAPHTIALKLIKLGLASRSRHQRFHYEAEVLSRLNHPGIAAFYEAGVHSTETDDIPYFAMEYVGGAKNILEYARVHRLSLTQRLKLFTQVCESIQHGHQKGVIHRDLKPSNILVDREGRPKVIDFGVAKIVDPDLKLTSLGTESGQLIGTLQYMSPEQCNGVAGDIDVRSDVYSLGMVLYELLVGKLPYEASSTSIVQAAKSIQESTRERISSRNRQFRGDLEAIVHKALDKARDQRYASAGEMGKDINRFLQNEPIEARRPGFGRQLLLMARRHKIKAAFATIAVFLLLGASLFGFVSFLEVKDAAEKAERAFDEGNLRELFAWITEVQTSPGGETALPSSLKEVARGIEDEGSALWRIKNYLNEGDDRGALFEAAKSVAIEGFGQKELLERYLLWCTDPTNVREIVRSQSLVMIARLFLEMPVENEQIRLLTDSFRRRLVNLLNDDLIGADLYYVVSALSCCGGLEEFTLLFDLLGDADLEPEFERMILRSLERIVRREHRSPQPRLPGRWSEVAERIDALKPQEPGVPWTDLAIAIACLYRRAEGDHRSPRKLPLSWTPDMEPGDEREWVRRVYAACNRPELRLGAADGARAWGWTAAVFRDGELLDTARQRAKQELDSEDLSQFEKGVANAVEEKNGIRRGHDELDMRTRFDYVEPGTPVERSLTTAGPSVDTDENAIGGWQFDLQEPVHWGVAESATGLGVYVYPDTLDEDPHLRFDRFCLSEVRLPFRADPEENPDGMLVELQHAASSRIYFPYEGIVSLQIDLDENTLRAQQRLIRPSRRIPDEIRISRHLLTNRQQTLRIKVLDDSTTTYRILGVTLRRVLR